MLVELAVQDLGVIERLSLVLGPGMTAVTGETGAGKTLVVTAIDLLVGGRADAGMVATGADEAVVEGRFEDQGAEIVVRRVVPAEGRSRAYIDGRLATVGELAELGARLVDLHGQHAHQSLLRTSVQRDALDRFGDIDLAPRAALRAEQAEIEAALQALGGDERARAREIDLLRFQVTELDAAGLQAGEDEALDAEETLLADATSHREAAGVAAEVLAGDEGVETLLGMARAALAGRTPFEPIEQRLKVVSAEVADLARELHTAAEQIADDPERLAEIRVRRQLIHDLRRKYGSTIDEIAAFRDEAAGRLAELESHDARAAELDRRLRAVLRDLRAADAAIGEARQAAAPQLATRAETYLRGLALPDGRLSVALDPARVDEVELLFTANPGSPMRPLRKVASGGELARVMLALRLVLTAGPETLVFDEVDAGIGGSAALAVGRSLAELGGAHQVLVVTHLPQVAAYADAQVAVTKSTARGGATTTTAALLGEHERILELSRMLAGTAESDTANEAAAELVATATAERGR
jgi:DNA repair protein RecN (Recombination protein N)